MPLIILDSFLEQKSIWGGFFKDFNVMAYSDKKDSLFLKKTLPESFLFDHSVVEVFDNMVERSVPFYSHLLKVISLLTREYYISNSNIVDLGCSTGNILRELEGLSFPFNYVGIDSSPDMIRKAEEVHAKKGNLNFICKNLLNIDYPVSSVCIANLTLQFIVPHERIKVLKSVCDSLLNKGVFIMVEKVIEEHEDDRTLFGQVHHQFKKEQGYSQLEIANKRDALINVLTPLTVQDNMRLLAEAGFARSSIFFKWFNFAGFIATK